MKSLPTPSGSGAARPASAAGSARRPPRRAPARAGRRRRPRRHRSPPPRATRARPARTRARVRAIASAQPRTSRAIGPAWSKLGASGKQPSSDTRPNVGLKPTIPQHAAGIRIEPPESVPSARSAAPSTSARRCRRSTRPRPGPGTRVRDDPEVRVLGGHPVGELVQVRLADDAVARRPRARRPRARCRRARARRRAASRTW